MELKTYNGPSASRSFTHQNIDIACIISYPMLFTDPHEYSNTPMQRIQNSITFPFLYTSGAALLANLHSPWLVLESLKECEYMSTHCINYSCTSSYWAVLMNVIQTQLSYRVVWIIPVIDAQFLFIKIKLNTALHISKWN